MSVENARRDRTYRPCVLTGDCLSRVTPGYRCIGDMLQAHDAHVPQHASLSIHYRSRCLLFRCASDICILNAWHSQQIPKLLRPLDFCGAVSSSLTSRAMDVQSSSPNSSPSFRVLSIPELAKPMKHQRPLDEPRISALRLREFPHARKFTEHSVQLSVATREYSRNALIDLPHANGADRVRLACVSQ